MTITATSVPTPELAEGDVIRNSGCLIRLVREQFRRPCAEGAHGQGHCDQEHGHGELVSFVGVILNPDSPDCDQYMLNLAAGERPHRERNGRWCPEGDAPLWIVQGNALARWARVDA